MLERPEESHLSLQLCLYLFVYLTVADFFLPFFSGVIFGSNFGTLDVSGWQNIQFWTRNPNFRSKISKFESQAGEIRKKRKKKKTKPLNPLNPPINPLKREVNIPSTVSFCLSVSRSLHLSVNLSLYLCPVFGVRWLILRSNFKKDILKKENRKITFYLSFCIFSPPGSQIWHFSTSDPDSL